MKQFVIFYLDDVEEESEYWINANSKEEALDKFYKVEENNELDYPFNKFIKIEETSETFEKRLKEK